MNSPAGGSAHTLRVLSYNLWHGRAEHELEALAETHDPDVLCIQEARPQALSTRIGPLLLAATTPRNRLTVAVYARESRFEVEQSAAIKVSISRHDRFVGGTDHRLAAARVEDRVAGRRVVLGSFHGTPFTDSNRFRRIQVDDAHNALTELGPGLATMMAGDYNHPILLGMLRRHIKRQGYTMAVTATTTFRKEGNIMRGKFDLATVSGLEVVSAEALPPGASDHRPVLFTLRYPLGSLPLG